MKKLRLREILREQGRNQGWLAKQLGVKYIQVQNWRHKKKCPDAETLSKMAEILEIEQDKLFETKLERAKRISKPFKGWSKFLPPIFKP